MPGGRPSKPLELVTGHRTKAEKEVRAKAEKELMTGTKLKEWPEVKADPIAHKEFGRLRKLLKSIKYDDDLWGTMINNLAKLKAEEAELIETKNRFIESMEKADEIELDSENVLNYVKTIAQLAKSISSIDSQIMAKRKMTLDISKENIMTIQSALRSVPKKPTEDKKSPMAEYLQRKQAGKTSG